MFLVLSSVRVHQPLALLNELAGGDIPLVRYVAGIANPLIEVYVRSVRRLYEV